MLRLRTWFAALLEREVLVLGVVTFYVVGVASTLPAMLVQDSWLALVSGREVARHGLPSFDQLTIWTHGIAWVDQQWLGQVAFYGLYVAGGWRLLMLGLLALLVATLTVALVAARRRASPLSVTLIGAACVFMAPWALQLRAQAFAGLLFVLLLWLLAEDSRAPSNRVLLAIPILVLWANVHGTVVFGAALLGLRALLLAVDGVRRSSPVRLWGRTSAALLVAAPLCTVASPYGLDLLGYYRRTLASPLLRQFVLEWRPSTPSAATAIFYVVAFASIWLLARQGRRLTGFEKLAFLLTLVAAVAALRSIVWFSLAALVLLPELADAEFSEWRSLAGPRLRRLLGGVAVAAIAAAFVGVASRPASWFTRDWSPAAAHRAAAIAADDPSARIFADDRYADWLLWEQPQLRGRLAYDIRFELFSRPQLQRLFDYQSRMTDGKSVTDGYRLLVVDLTRDKKAIQRALGHPGAQLVYRNRDVAVATQPTRATILR